MPIAKPNTPNTAAPDPAAAVALGAAAGFGGAIGTVEAHNPSPEAQDVKQADPAKVPERADIMPPGTALQHADPVQNPPLNTAVAGPATDYVVRDTYPPMAAGQRDQDSEHEIGVAGGDVETTAPPR